MKLILASGSPRRAELLERMGLTFTVRPADIDETFRPDRDPREEVARISREKARAVAALSDPDSVILSADTVVVLDNRILGKPHSTAEAEAMLTALSGRSHLVLTGVTVMGPGGVESRCCETQVCFRELSPSEIRAYIRTGEPMDKAGAYGIQGYAALFTEKILGDYYNVMGLPVCETGLMLRRAGIPVMEADI